MVISLGIIGIAGRMGKALSKLILKDNSLELLGGIRKSDMENPESMFLKENTFSLMQKCDVILDFSSPNALDNILKAASIYSKPLVIGTTGYTTDQLQQIKEKAQSIPILMGSNFSIGIAICKLLASTATEYTPETFNTIIEETHHIHKKDKPSGTALALKTALKTETPIISHRKGSVVGKHKIIFSSSEETFEISHEAHTRDVFAKGAILCAKYLYNQKKPGLYSIEDTLVFKK